MISQARRELRRSWQQSSRAGNQPGLRRDRDFGATCGYSGVDAIGGVFRRGCNSWRLGGEVEPCAFGFRVIHEFRVVFSAGAHQARTHGRDANALVAEYNMQFF